MSDVSQPFSWATIGNADGEQVVPFLRPGGELRFAIGTPEAHGLLWKLGVSRRDLDVYLIVRTRRTLSKWSFHASGDWRLQHIEEHVAATGVERIVDQWRRPEPDQNGHIHVFAIHTPGDGIRPVAPNPLTRRVKWIPAPPSDRIVSVHIMMLMPDRRIDLPEGSYILAVIPLVDGSGIVVVVEEQPILPLHVKMFQAIRSQARSMQAGQLQPHDRVTGHGESAGFHYVWDIVIDPVGVDDQLTDGAQGSDAT